MQPWLIGGEKGPGLRQDTFLQVWLPLYIFDIGSIWMPGIEKDAGVAVELLP
jgi:hypothetical protein